jgi:hypothetical protein
LVAGGFNFCTGVLNTCVWMLIKSDKNVTIKRMFCQYMIVSLKFVVLWWICTAFGERKAAHGAGVLASMEEFNEILYPKNTIRL